MSDLPVMTSKEQRFQKQRVLSHDFRDMSEQDCQLHHTVAATWYIAHKNLKAYRILYPLCAVACIGAMAGLCAAKVSNSVKAAGLIALPFCAATAMNKRDKAIQEARRAKEECHQVLSQFRNGNQESFAQTDFEEAYPAMYAQSNTLRASLLKHKGPFSYLLMRSWADMGADMWKDEHVRG